MSRYSGSYGAFQGASLLTLLLFPLAIGILMLVAQWRLFKKAGEPGWKCLIPFYGTYIWCRIVWSAKAFWAMIGIGFGTGILSSILTGVAANSYSRRSGSSAGGVILAILMIAASIASLVLAIKMLIYTARAYGKSGGFAVGLFFLMPIFYCILAFGDSRYVGPMGIAGSRQYGTAPEGEDTAASGSGESTDDEPVASRSSKNSLIWIVVGVCALILGISAVQRFILAMTSYRPGRGTAGSPWVGLENFQYLFRNPSFSRTIVNAAVYGFFRLVVSFLFSLLGGAAGTSGSRGGKAAAVAFGVLIAFIPSVLYDYMMVGTDVIRSSGFNPLIPIIQALPFGGVSLLLGALLTDVWPKERFRGVLVAPLLALATFFFEKYSGSLLQNALNLQYTETLASFCFKTGFQMVRYSTAAAAELMQSLMNLIPVAAGALMIALMVRTARPATVRLTKEGTAVSVIAGTAAGGLVLAAGILLVSSSPSIFRQSTVLSPAVSGFVAALIVAVLAFGVYFAVLMCTAVSDRERWLPLSLIILLSVGFNRTSVADYIAAMRIGVVNTPVMPILQAIVNPLSVMLMIGMIILRPRNTTTCVLLALGAALLSAAYVMGDTSSYMIYVMNRSQQNLGLLTRSVLQMAEGAEIRTGIAGMLLLFISVPLGVGTALCIRAAQRES